MKIYKDIQQHSQEWIDIRKGKITGSVITKLVSPLTLKASDSKTSEAALLKIIASKYAIKDSDSFETYAMAKGTELEPRARDFYSLETMQIVDEVAFIESDCGMYGMSPDGLVGDDGFIEIKCPNQTNFFKAKLTQGKSLLIDDCYKLQILIAFVLNDNFKWCDLVVYNEDFPKEMRMSIFRINRDEEEVTKLKEAISILIEKMQLFEKTLELN